MKRKFTLILLLNVLITTSAQSQLIDNRTGRAFEDEMFFSEEFIENNNIESVRGESWIKRNGETMKKLPGGEEYVFGEEGKLKKLYKVRKMFGSLDTLHILWDYNSHGNVVEKVESDKRGFYAERNEYGEEERLEEKRYYRYSNKSTTRARFEPREEYLINKEQFEYKEIIDTVTVRITLNNHGLPYKKVKTVKNSNGYLLSETLEYTVSGQKIRSVYSYNNNGWISSIKEEHSPGGNTSEKKFVYGEMGNLLFIDHFENGKKKYRTELIYDERMLLHSTIHRELESNIMNITKYFFTFRKGDKE
ncbi:hypothetical protein [Halocola ammonii]